MHLNKSLSEDIISISGSCDLAHHCTDLILKLNGADSLQVKLDRMENFH